jgi:hypothetical protein
MSSCEAISGQLARADGKAARNECPVIIRASSPIMGLNSEYNMSFVLLFVKYEPSDSMKTGTFGLDKSHILLSLFIAFTGQYWLFGCRKRSTISPDGDLFFVIFILKATCS